MNKLKDVLFDLFDTYGNDYYIIVSTLRSMNSERVLSGNAYDTIMCNYDKWLKEYKESRENNER